MPRKAKPKFPTKIITFTEDVVVLDHNKEVEFTANRGDVKELKVPSAKFWLVRNKAVEGDVKLDGGEPEEVIEEKIEEELDTVKDEEFSVFDD